MKSVLIGTILILVTALMVWVWVTDYHTGTTAAWVFEGFMLFSIMAVWWYGFALSLTGKRY